MKKLNLPISISVGVNDDAYKTLKDLYDAELYPDYEATIKILKDLNRIIKY